tara:strand:- start:169 stop:627 length:459 start_codon:yes stop_codon:yes gene_type:complete
MDKLNNKNSNVSKSSNNNSSKMNNNSKNNKKINNKPNINTNNISNKYIKQEKTSFLTNIKQLLFGSDTGFVITMIGGLFVLAVVAMAFLDQKVPAFRTNLVSNIMGYALAIFFIYIVYEFMGKQITVLGKSFDFGMIIYLVVIVLCVVMLSG